MRFTAILGWQEVQSNENVQDEKDKPSELIRDPVEEEEVKEGIVSYVTLQ